MSLMLMGTALAGPSGGVVTAGSADIAGQGSAAVSIQQHSQRVVINWQSFDTQAHERVDFYQPNSNAVALNRISNGNPTQFLGSLQANGKVIVMNPNGIVFGQSAKVDVNGLVATTANISDQNFMSDDQLVFDQSGDSNAKIINNGSISIGEAGLAGFVAPHVENNGLIQASLGKVQLVSGSTFTLDLAGDQLVNIAIDDAVTAQLVKNTGQISAQGGEILITAAQARNAVDNLIVNTGVIEATSVSEKGGTIILDGNDAFINHSGVINASGKSGGNVTLKSNDISLNGKILATGSQGNGGTVKVLSDKYIIAGSDTKVDVSGSDGGAITQNALGSFSSGHYLADGITGKGGRIEWGGNISLLSAELSTNGQTEGGQIHLGGLWKNQTSAGWDVDGVHLDAAENIFLSAQSTLRSTVVGAVGNGGEIVLRSQNQTYFGGTIDTRQGIDSGNAGRAEVSGNQIQLLDGHSITTGQFGRSGELLFDPRNITISSAAQNDSLALVKIAFGLALNPNDNFGYSTALNDAGNILAVGATGDDTGGTNRGAVYLFNIDPSQASYSPVLRQKIAHGTAGGALADNDFFGSAVAFNGSGSLLAVGAYGSDGGGALNADKGAVILLGLNTSNLTLAPTIYKTYTNGVDGITLADGDSFGLSVSLNTAGNILAIGAFADDTGGGNRGAAYLLGLNSSDYTAAITSGYKLSDSSPGFSLANSDYFGYSVALNGAGNILAVGAQRDDTGGVGGAADRGAVYLFNVDTGNLNNAPTYRKKITSGSYGITLSDQDYFGVSVALNSTGDFLVVGAFGDDTGGSARGAIYTFNLDASNLTYDPVFRQKGAGIATTDNDNFGRSVSMNDTGSMLFVGAQNDTSGRGAVYGFNLNPAHLFTSNVLGYNAGPGVDSTISTAFLTALLNTGNNITLQANNDITISSAFAVNNPSGNGGHLTLQAGRSIYSTQNITTDNGNLTLIANDTLANGVVDAYRLAGVGEIVINAGTTINAGTGTVSFITRNGAGKTFSASGNTTLGIISAGSILVETSQNITLTGQLTTSNTGNALVLSGNALTNTAGATVLNPTGGGRYLVYTANPSGNTLNGITGFTKRYNRTYTGYAPASVAETGNVFLHSVAPVITVTAENKTKIYGDANPAFTATYGGYIDGDTAGTAFSGAADLTTTATTATGVGTPAITASVGTLASALGYTFSYVNGTLTIDPAALTVTAANKTKVYGAGNPALTLNFSGLKNGDVGTTVFTGYSLTTAANGSSGVGSYAISLTGGTAANYTITRNDGSLSVTPAALTITADDKTKTVGDPNPVLTVTYTGFVNGDTDAVVAGLTTTTAATIASPVGNYTITPSGATSGNYSITFVNGNLSVNPVGYVPPPSVPDVPQYVTENNQLLFVPQTVMPDMIAENPTISYVVQESEQEDGTLIFDFCSYKFSTDRKGSCS